MAISVRDARAIASTASRLGVDPRTLGALMDWESGLNPNVWGGAGGKYRGLIQFGPGARQEVGLPDRPMTIEEQMPYVEKYFNQRGFKPGEHGPTELYRTVLVGNPRQSGTDSFGTNSDSAARRMMPGGDLYQRFSGKFDPIAGKLGAGDMTPQVAPQIGTSPMPGGSPEDRLLEALSDPTRLMRSRPLAATAGDSGALSVPGIEDLTNPLGGIWKAIAAGSLGAGLANRLGLPREILGNPMAEQKLQGELKRRQAAQVLTDAYTIMNPTINLSDLMNSSSRRPSPQQSNPLAALMSNESTSAGTLPKPVGPGGNPEVIEYLTGDTDHAGFRPDHGGDNYHEHLAFRSREARDAAMAKLKAAGIQIGSVNDGRHAPNSYHYQDMAFDVPAAQVPVGQEKALSRRVREILGLG